MKKTLFKTLLASILFVLLSSAMMPLQAQPPMTVRDFVSGGGTSVNTYAAVGQPFFQQINGQGYEIAYGVAQSQLEVLEREDETCINEPYNDYGFDIPASELSEGNLHYERYTNNVYDIFGYDRLTMLDLTVWPIYEVETSETYHYPLPIIDGSKLKSGIDYQVVEGENTIVYLSVHGCDSVVKLNIISCPLTVKDADSNQYNVVMIDHYCWTPSNLKTTHYFGNSHVEIPQALIYSPGEQVNEEIYGRLYTWYSAFNVPEGSSESPVLDEDGFIRGICPAGWHLPASPEMASLESYSSYETHSPDLWIYGAGANTTGFTLLPAGLFNAAKNRFEGLRTDARMWNAASTGTTIYHPKAYDSPYYCDEPFIIFTSAADAYSVRCVKNY